MKHSFNSDLVDDVARRRTALFLGAGVSASVRTNSGSRIMQWNDFIRYLAASVPQEATRAHALRLTEEGDLLMACELIRDALGQEEWEKRLQAEYAQVGQMSDLYRSLIGLRQRLIITTNFDKFLEDAWSKCNPRATHYPKIEVEITDESFKAFRDSREYIFKLHGSIDDPPSIIFSKSDYTNRAYGSWAYTKFLETVLLTHTILFVGFSMKDPAISFVLEMYAHHLPRSRPHYIFLAGEHSTEYVEVAKKLRRLFVIPYSDAQEHRELIQIISELGDQAARREREIVAQEWPESLATASSRPKPRNQDAAIGPKISPRARKRK